MPYALCPMPYALCPMPYPHEYLIFLRKAIEPIWDLFNDRVKSTISRSNQTGQGWKWVIPAMWTTKSGKLSSHYYHGRKKLDRQCGQSDKSLMAYFINSRTVVIGLTYPRIYRPIRLFSGITKIGVKTARSIRSWQHCIARCANKSKKTTVDDIDHSWLTSGEKHL